MNLQIGGLKLKDKNKKGFLPIFDMVNKPTCVLDVLTYESLKGFMVSLNISPEETEYLGLSDQNQFTKPITSFILKFAVITKNNDDSLPEYKDIEKSSESKESYYEEAKLQQNIWKKSITGGRPEICPPVANFSLFDNDNSKELCTFFQEKTTGDMRGIFNYLFDCINNTIFGIGVIVMPKIVNSTTFGDFLEKDVSLETRNDVYASVSAQIIRLFIDVGVIHFDLHNGNVLVCPPNTTTNNNSNNLTSIIIDFGRASNILNDVDDEYLDKDDKEELTEQKNEFLNTLLSMDIDASDKEKRKFILSVLDLIADTDFTENQKLLEYSDPERYQMDWYREYPRRSDVPVLAFDILKNSITTEGIKISPVTIKKYENDGYIFSFKSDVKGPCKFFVNFPKIINTKTSLFNIMSRPKGGKKNTKSKRINMSKKSKTMRLKRKK
jgi:hypothetical protein